MYSFLQLIQTSLVLLVWVNLSKRERKGVRWTDRERRYSRSHLSTDTSTHTDTAAAPHLQFNVKHHRPSFPSPPLTHLWILSVVSTVFIAVLLECALERCLYPMFVLKSGQEFILWDGNLCYMGFLFVFWNNKKMNKTHSTNTWLY